MSAFTYDPSIFNVRTVEQAKRIILTPAGERTSEVRWEAETPYLVSLIEDAIQLGPDSIVLDYGCGIGRMAKALIDKHACRVVGVDISPSMRALAAAYVSSPRFFVCAPDALSWLGVKFDLAVAVWVLQHCAELAAVIASIHNALAPGGRLFVVNDRRRFVPAREATWVDDGQDIRAMLKATFGHGTICELDPRAIGAETASASFWATYQRTA